MESGNIDNCIFVTISVVEHGVRLFSYVEIASLLVHTNFACGKFVFRASSALKGKADCYSGV